MREKFEIKFLLYYLINKLIFHLKLSKEKGFSLIELVVVVSVLSVLSAIAIPSFICFPKRAKATAALAALRQIKTECAVKKTEVKPGIFTSIALDGYTIQTSGSNSCIGSNGVISALPFNTNELPTFNLAVATDKLSYSFKGETGTNFIDCLALICSGNNKSSISKNNNLGDLESFDGEKGLLGDIEGLKTVSYGYYFLSFQPEKFKVGQRMALLRPGGDGCYACPDLKFYLEAVSDTQYRVVVAGSYHEYKNLPSFLQSDTFYEFGEPNNIGLRYTSGNVTLRDEKGNEFRSPMHGFIRENIYKNLGFDPYAERPSEIGFFQNPKLFNDFINRVQQNEETTIYSQPIKPYKGKINSIKHYDLTAVRRGHDNNEETIGETVGKALSIRNRGTEDEWLFNHAKIDGESGLLFSTDGLDEEELSSVDPP